MNYEDAIEWLNSLKVEGGFKTQTGLQGMEQILQLERIEALLKKLGEPQEQFKTVHVAGTSGKGSTTYFTASILQQAGYKTGLMVSPHLQTFNDCVAVNGENISDTDFAALATQIFEKCDEVAVQNGYPTRFEILTTLAFMHFVNSNAEVAVIEAGLGGERDATNVIKPLLSIITSISLDHAKTLGPTIENIALSKAGIIKTDTPVVAVANLPIEALKVIEKRAGEKNSPLVFSKKCKLISINFNGMKFTGEFAAKPLELETRAAGLFQLENAAHALKAAELLAVHGYKIDEAAVVNGFRSVSIPCRFEAVQSQPLIILDGAHNPAKAAALAETLRLLEAKPDFVVGILEAKPAGEILNLLRPVANSFTFIQPALAKNFHSTGELQEITDTRGIESQTIDGSEEELFNFIRNYGGKLLCITGSLYLAGMARNYWFPAEGE